MSEGDDTDDVIDDRELHELDLRFRVRQNHSTAFRLKEALTGRQGSLFHVEQSGSRPGMGLFHVEQRAGRRPKWNALRIGICLASGLPEGPADESFPPQPSFSSSAAPGNLLSGTLSIANVYADVNPRAPKSFPQVCRVLHSATPHAVPLSFYS